MGASRRGGTGLKFLVLMGMWMVFSGKPDALHLGFGILSVGFVMWLTRGLRLENVLTVRRRPLGRPRWKPALRYPFWLLKEVAKANLQMARIILDPRLPIDPALVRFDSRLDSSLAHVLLANSITLTPGTFTVDVTDGVFEVHALTEAGVTGTTLGTMRSEVAAVFGENIDGPAELMEIERGEVGGPS